MFNNYNFFLKRSGTRIRELVSFLPLTIFAVMLGFSTANLQAQDEFNFPCGGEEGTLVEIAAVGFEGGSSSECISIAGMGVPTNEVDEIEVYYYARFDFPTSVTFSTSSGFNQTVTTFDDPGGGGRIYRTTIPNLTGTNVSQACAQVNGTIAQSNTFGAFVFYSPPNALGGISGSFEGEYLYWGDGAATNQGTEDCLTRTIDLPAVLVVLVLFT